MIGQGPFCVRVETKKGLRVREAFWLGNEGLVQLANAELAEVDQAAGIVALDGDGSFAEALGLFFVVVGLGVFVGHFSVDSDGDLFSFDLDVISEPFVVDMAGGFDVFEAVDAAGFTPVLLSGVDLAFIADIGPSFFLIGGVDEDARIGVLGGFDFAFEFEVFELGVAVLAVEEVGTRSDDFDGAVFDGEGGGVLGVDLPAVESFPVEHLHPFSSEGEFGKDNGESGGNQFGFHWIGRFLGGASEVGKLI